MTGLTARLCQYSWDKIALEHNLGPIGIECYSEVAQGVILPAETQYWLALWDDPPGTWMGEARTSGGTPCTPLLIKALGREIGQAFPLRELGQPLHPSNSRFPGLQISQ